MAIRVRSSNGMLVALCAAETNRQPDDIYLDDAAHEALSAKFAQDFISMGFMAETPPYPQWIEMGKYKVRDAETELDSWHAAQGIVTEGRDGDRLGEQSE